MKQSHLHRLRKVNADIKAHNEQNPPPIAKKVFTAKNLIMVLDDYNFDQYPPIYLAGWTRLHISGTVKLEGACQAHQIGYFGFSIICKKLLPETESK